MVTGFVCSACLASKHRGVNGTHSIKCTCWCNQPGKMRVRCAWHPQYFGAEKILREAAPSHESDPPSDGICADCKWIVLSGTPQNRNRRTP